MNAYQPAFDVLSMGIPDLQAYADRTQPLIRTETSNLCMSVSESAAFAAYYITGRDQGMDHDRAVSYASRVTKKVRKALGYTYP